MKFPHFFFILLIISVCSCNTDDASTDDTALVIPEYYPLTEGTYWTYNNQNEQVGPSRDSLYVASEEMHNDLLYVNLDAQTPATAFMTQLLSENILKTTETQLIINGTLGSPVNGLPDISLPLDDMRLFDTNVDIAIDPVMDISNGSITQDIMEIPITTTYGITSIMLDTPETASEESPQIASQLILNMEIVAMVPFGPITIPFTIMQSQDVLVATTIYTEGIGLTNANVLVSITLEDLSALGIELPFPENSSTSSTQTIDSFSIGD